MAMQIVLNWLTACLFDLNIIFYPVSTFVKKQHRSLSDSINEIANIDIYFAVPSAPSIQPDRHVEVPGSANFDHVEILG